MQPSALIETPQMDFDEQTELYMILLVTFLKKKKKKE